MNYSQMKDERLLAFYEHVRQQVALDVGSHYRLLAMGSAPMRIISAKKWTSDGLSSRQLIGQRTDDGNQN
jgi:hypothetical protein